MLKSLTLATVKFKALSGSLTSSDVSVPGYIYEEAVKITFRSRKDCIEVLEFILSVLNDVTSPVQKLKALKMLKHVAERGDSAFTEMLVKQDRHIKEAASFSSLNDQMHGNNLSASVRKEAQELLSFIHSTSRLSRPILSGNYISGMGSTTTVSSGKYDGFGSSQPVSTNMYDRVMNGITSFMDDWRKSGTVNAAEVESKIERELKLDNGSYRPVKIPNISKDPTNEADFKLKSPVEAAEKEPKVDAVKPRVAGRPGGGWDDDDDLSEAEKHQQLISKLNEISVQENADAKDLTAYVAEENFVKDLLERKSQFTSWKEVDQLTNSLKSLDVERVVILLSNELKHGNDSTLAILQLIEEIINQGCLSLEGLHLILIDTINATTEHSSTIISCKARKVKLIIEKSIVQMQLKQAEFDTRR